MNPQNVEEIVKYNGPDRVVHFTDYLLERATNTKTSKCFLSGFPQFDKKTGGLEVGEVIVVSGHRKAGKTLFAESWIKAMAQKSPDAKALILSFEVQTEKLLVKYMNHPELSLYVPMTLQTMDFEWLRTKCAEAKYKYNCRIVMIDHLHFMVDFSDKHNMGLNIGGFMRRLKFDIANNLGLAVILLAHQGQPREGREPSVDTLRDSSTIGQESDATIIVMRQENYTEKEIDELELKRGSEVAAMVRPPLTLGEAEADPYSAGLATIKVDCHRRTGTYQWKKLFQKRGEFLAEI